MKQSISTIMFFAVASLIVMGCEDNGKRDKCEYYASMGMTPDSCLNCQWEAPETASVSYSDYNTVSAFRDCFVCHRWTLQRNLHKTFRLEGWIYWGSEEEGERLPAYMQENYDSMVHSNLALISITDNENHLGWNRVFPVIVTPEFDSLFLVREHREKMLEKKWYITGTLEAHDMADHYPPHGDKCCFLVPYLQASQLDTINPLEAR